MSMSKDDKDKAHSLEERFFGTATVGERGQIVIPAEARKRFGIETGEKLLIMGTPDDKGIMLFKFGAMREFVTHMLKNMELMEKEISQIPAEDHTS